MPYDNITDATNAGNLIPEETVSEILKNVPKQSAAMDIFRRVPLSTRTWRQNVLSALPVAYFVNGDTGLKQTTEMAWTDVQFVVEEIAVLFPVPRNVIDDLEFDIWAEAQPLIEEAVGRLIDGAVFFGTNKPASWPAAIVPGAVAAGNNLDVGATMLPGSAGWGTVFDDALSDVMSLVEADGYAVDTIVIPRTLMGRFRKARDADGARIFDVRNLNYEGVDMTLAMDGQWPAGTGVAGNQDKPEVIMLDSSKGMIGVRKDITFETFREGVITDSGSPPVILLNLMQQDSEAMRVTMRLAWASVNPISYANTNAATRYFAAVLRNDQEV